MTAAAGGGGGRRGSCSSAIRSAWWSWSYDSTLPVTMDDMVRHAQAVLGCGAEALAHRRTCRGFVPRGWRLRFENAARASCASARADAVKIEGDGKRSIAVVRALSTPRSPSWGTWPTPQSVPQDGRLQGRRPRRGRSGRRSSRTRQGVGVPPACSRSCLEDPCRAGGAAYGRASTCPRSGSARGPSCDGQVARDPRPAHRHAPGTRPRSS